MDYDVDDEGGVLTPQPEPILAAAPAAVQLNAPRQRRSADSWERALAAGARILAERGYEGLTVAAVCEEAKVATGSIYNRVRSKDALLHMIASREITRMIDEFRAAVAASTMPARTMPDHIRREVDLTTYTARNQPALWRAFFLRWHHDPDLWAITRALVTVLHGHFIESLLARRDEIVHPEPERAVEFCYDVVAGSLTRKLTVHHADEPLDSGWDRLRDEHAELFTVYLLSPGMLEATPR